MGHMAEGFKTLAFAFLTKWNGKVYPGSDDLHADVSDLVAIAAPGERPSTEHPVIDKVTLPEAAVSNDHGVTYKSLQSFPAGRRVSE